MDPACKPGGTTEMEQLYLAAGDRTHLVGGGTEVWGGGRGDYCHRLGYPI